MSDGAVWRFDPKSGAWRDVTPVKPNPARNQTFGYAAVAAEYRLPGGAGIDAAEHVVLAAIAIHASIGARNHHRGSCASAATAA